MARLAYHARGHRRHIAQLLALALRNWARERPATDITLEVVRTMVTTLVESLGSLEKVIGSLLARYGQEEVEFVAFEGGRKAQILALHAANYGSEKPDMLGIAHSFRQALEAGATAAEIAGNSGQHRHYVQNHLALTRVPAEPAGRIAAGELPMSVATAVAELPEPKRSGLAIFILANEPGKLTGKSIKDCAAALKKWPGLQMPLLPKHQSQRNVARALVRLWSQAIEAYPADAWAAAAMLIYRNVHEEPWAGQEKLSLWFQALGGDTYYGGEGINWAAVVAHLVEEVSCQSCPIAQLPAQSLRADLAKGRGGPLGMPCRAGAPAERCIHGLAPDDPFDVRVPWEWSGHPGVVHEGEYRVKDLDDLLRAWQAQAEKEAAADEAAEKGDEAQAADTAAPGAGGHGQGSANGRSSPAPAQPAAAPNLPPKESPVGKQRTLIASFMRRHEQLAANHPMATPCGRCRHRLESSPTRDEGVPPCAWAGRLRTVEFKCWRPVAGQGPVIPVCRQFAPAESWSERIPEHPAPPGMPASGSRKASSGWPKPPATTPAVASRSSS